MSFSTPVPGGRLPTFAMICGLVLAILLLGTLSLALGPAKLSLTEVISAFAGTDPINSAIVLEMRLPRAILGLLVGLMLGAAGTALQAYLRNPLADPSVLGASNGAAFGGVIALYFGLAKTAPIMLPALSIAGALGTLLILLLLSKRAKGTLGLVLAGIAVSAFASAGIALALNLAPSPFGVMEITFWLMGSLEDRSFSHVWIALPTVLIGLGLLAWNARALDALVLGEEGARSLGVDIRAMQRRIILAVAIGVGGAVAVSGAVGFVGLIAPHLVRPFTDGRPSRLLLPAALVGAALVMAADTLVRIIPGQTELRLGVVTAFLGVPFFLFYLLKERNLW